MNTRLSHNYTLNYLNVFTILSYEPYIYVQIHTNGYALQISTWLLGALLVLNPSVLFRGISFILVFHCSSVIVLAGNRRRKFSPACVPAA